MVRYCSRLSTSPTSVSPTEPAGPRPLRLSQTMCLARLAGFARADRDKAGLRNGKLLGLHHDRLGLEFRQNPVRDVGDQLLHQLPASTLAELQQVIRHGLVVDRPFDAVADRGG